MMKKEYRLQLGDMLILWTVSDEKEVFWTIIPAAMESSLVAPRQTVAECEDAPTIPTMWQGIPLREPHCPVQVCRTGDALQDNCGGLTLQWSSTTKALRFRDMVIDENDGSTQASLELETADGLIVRQCLHYCEGEDAFKLWTEVQNGTVDTQRLDHISSALLSGITPFAVDDASGDLFLHRFKAGWSSEGRHLEQQLEDLELERAWAPHGLRVERFGQCGSKPTQLWMPWIGVEHRSQGVVWALHYEAVGTWQAEVLRRDDALSISVNEGDRLFGNRQIILAAGENYQTPAAWVTVCQGDVQDSCARLTSCQTPLNPSPADQELPIIFNEWCTTWGEPTHENMVAIAERLEGTPCRYQVIDAGWYQPDNGADWSKAQGDWVPNKKLFPEGLKATCDAIRQRGLIPGIWFEFEVAGKESKLFDNSDIFLQRDGVPVQEGERRFLDLRQEESRRYLEDTMFALLEECGIGYLKIDYNGNTGGDIDGDLSYGANLSEHMEQVVGIFKKLRERFPELVIENCASGGQRLTPAYTGISDMHSFSDAHTCVDIPVIAANVLSQIPAAQSQIWAVLNAEESLQRISYSLSATFLGRMCLSGDIHHLSDDAWDLAREAMDFYRKVWPVIKDGRSRRFGQWSRSMRKLRGWQAVVREGSDSDVLVVFHAFGDGPDEVQIPVPSNMILKNSFGHELPDISINDGLLTLSSPVEQSGCVLWLAAR